MISAATTRTIVQKRCKAYLAYVVDVEKVDPSLLDIPLVCDYMDVFLEEFSGLPPQREIEFTIEFSCNNY